MAAWFSGVQKDKRSSDGPLLYLSTYLLIVSPFAQQELNRKLPTGSRFRFELAYCGAGYEAMQLEEKKGEGKGLANASSTHVGEFNWVSNAWSHLNFDYLPPEACDGKANTCKTSQGQALVELDYNSKTILGEGLDAASLVQDFKGVQCGLFGVAFDSLLWRLL